MPRHPSQLKLDEEEDDEELFAGGGDGEDVESGDEDERAKTKNAGKPAPAVSSVKYSSSRKSMQQTDASISYDGSIDFGGSQRSNASDGAPKSTPRAAAPYSTYKSTPYQKQQPIQLSDDDSSDDDSDDRRKTASAAKKMQQPLASPAVGSAAPVSKPAQSSGRPSATAATPSRSATTREYSVSTPSRSGERIVISKTHVDREFFFKQVQQAGADLLTSSSPIIQVTHLKFRRNIESSLSTTDSKKRFVDSLKNTIKKVGTGVPPSGAPDEFETELLLRCLRTVHSDDGSASSMQTIVKILMNAGETIGIGIAKAIFAVLGDIGRNKKFQETFEKANLYYNLPRLLMQYFKFLDISDEQTIEAMEKQAVLLVSDESKLSDALRIEFIHIIPEFNADHRSESMIKALRECLMNEKMTAAVLDALASISIPSLDVQREIQEEMLTRIDSASVELKPSFLKFLLSNGNDDTNPEVVTKLCEVLPATIEGIVEELRNLEEAENEPAVYMSLSDRFEPTESRRQSGSGSRRKSQQASDEEERKSPEVLAKQLQLKNFVCESMIILEMCLRIKQGIYKEFVKYIEKGSVNYDEEEADGKKKKEVSPLSILDLWVLFISSSIQPYKKKTELLFKRLCKEERITKKLISNCMRPLYGKAFAPLFPSLLSLASALVSHDDNSVTAAGRAIYTSLFETYSAREERLELLSYLITHTGSTKVKEVDFALGILNHLVKSNVVAMRDFENFISNMLEFLEGMTIYQLNMLYGMFAMLCYARAKSTSTLSSLRQNFTNLIRKYLSNIDNKYKRMGIIGAVYLLASLGMEPGKKNDTEHADEGSTLPTYFPSYQHELTYEEKDVSRDMLDMVKDHTKKDPVCRAFLFEQLCSVIKKGELRSDPLKKELNNWTYRELSKFILYVDPKATDVQISLNIPTTLKVKLIGRLAKHDTCISLIPYIAGARYATRSFETYEELYCLYPVFDLYSLTGGDPVFAAYAVESPITMIETSELSSSSIHSLSVREKEILCMALFNAINWCRECANVCLECIQKASEQGDEGSKAELTAALQSRLDTIVKWELILDEILHYCPYFTLHRVHFLERNPGLDADELNKLMKKHSERGHKGTKEKKPAAAKKKKPAKKKKAASKKKKSKDGDENDDDAENESDHEEPSDDEEEDEGEEESQAKSRSSGYTPDVSTPNISHLRQYYRELSPYIFKFLETIDQSNLSENIRQAWYVVRDLELKLTYLTHREKAARFGDTWNKSNVTELITIKTGDYVAEVLNVVPHLKQIFVGMLSLLRKDYEDEDSHDEDGDETEDDGVSSKLARDRYRKPCIAAILGVLEKLLYLCSDNEGRFKVLLKVFGNNSDKSNDDTEESEDMDDEDEDTAKKCKLDDFFDGTREYFLRIVDDKALPMFEDKLRILTLLNATCVDIVSKDHRNAATVEISKKADTIIREMLTEYHSKVSSVAISKMVEVMVGTRSQTLNNNIKWCLNELFKDKTEEEIDEEDAGDVTTRKTRLRTYELKAKAIFRALMTRLASLSLEVAKLTPQNYYNMVKRLQKLAQALVGASEVVLTTALGQQLLSSVLKGGRAFLACIDKQFAPIARCLKADKDNKYAALNLVKLYYKDVFAVMAKVDELMVKAKQSSPTSAIGYLLVPLQKISRSISYRLYRMSRDNDLPKVKLDKKAKVVKDVYKDLTKETSKKRKKDLDDDDSEGDEDEDEEDNDEDEEEERPALRKKQAKAAVAKEPPAKKQKTSAAAASAAASSSKYTKKRKRKDEEDDDDQEEEEDAIEDDSSETSSVRISKTKGKSAAASSASSSKKSAKPSAEPPKKKAKPAPKDKPEKSEMDEDIDEFDEGFLDNMAKAASSDDEDEDEIEEDSSDSSDDGSDDEDEEDDDDQDSD